MIVGDANNLGINHDDSGNDPYGLSLAMKTKKARTKTCNML